LPDEWLRLTGHTPLALRGATADFRRIVLEDVLAELDLAARYVTDLPPEAADYRQASLLCLLPALETNLIAARLADKSLTPEHRYKISRMTLGQCMLDARRLMHDDAAILAHSRRMMHVIAAARA